MEGKGSLRPYDLELSFSKIKISVTDVGEDRLILVSGGDKEHIGCTVLSFARPSLSGGGQISATSSVLNVTGHKDEEICRCLAEKLAIKEKCTVVCTGGFHADGIQKNQIDELIEKICFFQF